MKISFIFIILFSIAIQAQDTTRLVVKQAEFDNIKTEIKTLEEELKQTIQSEKKSVKLIENLNKQNLLLNKAISALKSEEKKRENKVSQTEEEISKIQNSIKSLRKSYEKYLIYLYKYGKDFSLYSIFNSSSFNQALIKYKYFNKITDQRERDLNKLTTGKNKLVSLRSELVKENEEKKVITSRKMNEEQQLQLKLSEKKEILKTLKGDKASLNEEIELKKKASAEIKNLITQLIIEERKKEEELKKEEERKKAEELKRQKELAANNKLTAEKSQVKVNEAEIPQSLSINNKIDIPITDVTKVIEEQLIRKGSLQWPVAGGLIYKKFGEIRNSKLNTVTFNNGIDIKAKNDLTVKSVAGGSVSVINWVPGYGSVLILTHKNGFRSVYGHLSEIYVSEGESIPAGSVIGKIGESLEGNILHFELWIERNNQNPEIWLARK